MNQHLKNQLKYLKTKHKIIIGICLLNLVGCDWFEFRKEPLLNDNAQKPIARVFDKYLYPEDIKELVSVSMSPQDSAKRVSKYVRNWFNKQLIIVRSETELAIDQTEIERKILDYRYALLAHEFEKNYVNQHLDTVITAEEVAAYYEEKKDNFILKQNIFKGKYIKLPRNSPTLGRFRALFRSADEEELEELRTYCLQFALNYSLDDNIWYKFDEVLINTPLISITNKAQFLRNNKNYESRDEEWLYFLSITDYRITDQTSPLEFVTDQIKNILLHKRKVDLVDKLEEEIYNEASKNNDIEIYEP